MKYLLQWLVCWELNLVSFPFIFKVQAFNQGTWCYIFLLFISSCLESFLVLFLYSLLWINIGSLMLLWVLILLTYFIPQIKLWFWRRLLRVPWTARRSNQSILKEISPGCSLEGIDACEFEWTPGDGDGQGGMACCDSWGRKHSEMTEWLNWTEMMNK